MSERRACRVIDADRKSVRYRSMRDDDPGLREKLRELANQNRRFGYRLLQILQRREGVMTDLRAQGGRAGVKSATQPRACSRAQDAGCGSSPPNQRWNLGFVHGQMASG